MISAPGDEHCLLEVMEGNLEDDKSIDKVVNIHSKTHSEEKSNKCNQCDFASMYARSLKMHLKIHSGEKPNKCKQCDFDSSGASQLRKPKKCT